MPEILEIAPKDIHVRIDFSLSEIRKLHLATGLSTLNYKGDIKDEKEAAEYFKHWFEFLSGVLKDIEHGIG